jgi:MoxR-like ATPase
MSARLAGLMALPTASLIVAVKAAGMAPQGTKVMDAKALDTLGWDADRVLAACSGGAGAASATAIGNAIDVGLVAQRQAAAAASDATLAKDWAENALRETTKLNDFINRLASDLTSAIGAAGAVASRAETAALAAQRRPAVDPADVASAVAVAVAAAIRPINDALAGATDAVKAAVMTVVAAPVGSESCEYAFDVLVIDRRGQPLTIDLWGHPDAPAVDPHYIWTEGLIRHLVLAQRTGENIWLGGPKGTGKSEAAKQWAAKTDRMFTRINFTKHTSPEDFVGAVGLANGATAFVPGDFLRAFVTPGAVILLDEISNADPANLAVLNALLEPNSHVNIGGQVWSRAAGVMVMGADNTLGNGDDSGRYAGTRSMNSSLLDRFARVLPFTYLPESTEVQALVRHTGCTDKLARHVVKAINLARAKVDTGDIVDAPSLRQLVAFIRALDLLSVAEAWATTIAAKQPPESLLALEAIRLASIDESLIEGEL